MAGAWSRFTTWLLGKQAERLKEEVGHGSWIAYLIFLGESAALLLVAGRTEIQYILGDHPLAIKAVMVLVVMLLVFTVWAAELTMVRSFMRVWPLFRNHQDWMGFEHMLYIAFVLVVENLSLYVVVDVVETRPEDILSAKPLVATGSTLFLVMVIGRVIMTGWTALQAQMVRQKIDPGMPALLTPYKEHLGGKAKQAVATLEVKVDDIPSLFESYAAVAAPMPRRRTWLNGWLIKRDQEHQEHEKRHLENVKRTLEAVTTNRLDEAEQRHAGELQAVLSEAERRDAAMQEKLTRAVEEARRMVQQAEETAQRALERELDQMRATFVRGLLHLSINKELPYDIAASFPEVAGLSFAGLGAAHGGSKREPKEPTTGKDKALVWLADMGITRVPTPDRKRGVWVTSTDAMKLVKESVNRDALRDVISSKQVGEGLKFGLSYIAPIDKLMDALSERHWLNEEAAKFWASYTEGRGKGSDKAATIGLTMDDQSGEERGDNVVNFR